MGEEVGDQEGKRKKADAEAGTLTQHPPPPSPLHHRAWMESEFTRPDSIDTVQSWALWRA